jgi:hypothetical protein
MPSSTSLSSLRWPAKAVLGLSMSYPITPTRSGLGSARNPNREWIHLTAVLPFQSLCCWRPQLLQLYGQRQMVLTPPNFEVDLKVGRTELWRWLWRSDPLYTLRDRLWCMRRGMGRGLRTMHLGGLLVELWPLRSLLLRMRVVLELCNGNHKLMHRYGR